MTFQKGHPSYWSKNSRQLMSERVRGVGNPFYGKHHTEETKQKLRLINLGKKLPEEVKQKIAARSGIGRRGKQFTDESKRKIALALRGKFDGINNPFYGRHHTEETIEKLKAINRNRSEEWRKKISLGNMGHISPNKGKKLSAETREKVRAARLKQVFPSKDTKIEVAMQDNLRQMGVAFRKHEPILGQPDLFIEPNICVFVDGCYWHGCPTCFTEKRSDYMSKRIASDKLVNEELSRKGYSVFRLWGHEIKNEADKVEKKLLAIKEASMSR